MEQKTGTTISNGRMDQYLYPYYKKDIEEGTLTSEEAKELLECMWVDMAQFIDLYINPTGNEFQEGYAHWEAVTVGGQTPEGEDATNELSYLFLESKREFPMTYPDLAVRIHSRTPDRFLYEIALTVQDRLRVPEAHQRRGSGAPERHQGLPDQRGAGLCHFGLYRNPYAQPRYLHLRLRVHQLRYRAGNADEQRSPALLRRRAYRP